MDEIKHGKHTIRCRFCRDEHMRGRANCDYCKGAGWVVHPAFALHFTPASHKPIGPCWSWRRLEGNELAIARLHGHYRDEDTAYFAACNELRRPATSSEIIHEEWLLDNVGVCPEP